MEAMRQSWSDDRLDDLSNRVDAGIAQGAAGTAQIRQEMRDGFDQINARFDTMQTMIRVGGSLIGVLVVIDAGLIATLL